MDTDLDLTDVLIDEDVVDVPVGFYKKHIEELEMIRNFAVVEAFYKSKENANKNFDSLTQAQQKNWTASHLTELPKWFSEIGKMVCQLRSGEHVKDIKPSRELEKVLILPSKKVAESESYKKVAMQLIARLQPNDVERLYLHNRVLFYDLYRSWPEGKKQWCVGYLKRRGHPRHINHDSATM